MKISLLRKTILFIGILVFLTPTFVWAQKETIGISAIKLTPAVNQSIEKVNKRVELDRVIQSLDGQLIDCINATRKFQVVVRSDLHEVLQEQEFASSGNVDLNDKSAAQQFKIAGVKYLVVTTVDDFQDYNEVATFQGTGRSATKRVIRLSCV